MFPNGMEGLSSDLRRGEVERVRVVRRVVVDEREKTLRSAREGVMVVFS